MTKMTQQQLLDHFDEIKRRLEAYCDRVQKLQERSSSDFWVMPASRQLNRNVNARIAQELLDVIAKIREDFEREGKTHRAFYQHLCAQFSKKSIIAYQDYAIEQLGYTDKTSNFVKRDIHSFQLKSILADARKYFPEQHAEFKQKFHAALSGYIEPRTEHPSIFRVFNASRSESRKLNVQLAGHLRSLIEKAKDVSSLKDALSPKKILSYRAELIGLLSKQDTTFKENFVDRGINSHDLSKMIRDMRSVLEAMNSLPTFEPATQAPGLS